MTSLSRSDEILASLAQVEESLEQGRTLDEACHTLGVPLATYQLWRRAHFRTCLAAARRLESLEQLRATLLEVLTDQQREIQSLQRRLEAHTGRPALG